MFNRKLGVFIFLLSMSSGLFAQNIMDVYFNGDDLNRKINKYVNNISRLIPDTTTQQDVWSFAPGTFGTGLWFGGGVNGTISFLDRSRVGGALTGSQVFGADNVDLAKFPEGVPFLPGFSYDLKGGFGRMDFSICGMWINETILADNGIIFFGEGSSFAQQAIGFNARYLVLKEGKVSPSITVQAGYFYTSYNFGVIAMEDNRKESVKIDLRNDSWLLGVHVGKNLVKGIITPYAGMKFMISNTDSEYEWHTNRAVLLDDRPYFNGLSYYSASNDGDVNFFGQIYAGAGFALPASVVAMLRADSAEGMAAASMVPGIVVFTLGGAYTIGTNHFSINASIRYVLGKFQ